MDTLQAIVYVSSSAQPMTPSMLEALLIEARRLNLESGVTGVLLYCDGTFMQYFEGTPSAMQETYTRIRQSRQHSRITELMNEPIATRGFPDWQMGLAKPTKSELLALSTANWVLRDSGSVARGIDTVGMTLLHEFWARHLRHL